MKRIVIIVSSLRRSGPIVVVQNLLRNIDRNKFDVQIVKLMEDEPSRSITSEFINDGFIVHELHSTKLKIELFPHGILKQLRKLLNVIKPDLIHTHGYQACLLGAKLADEYKVVETLHCIAKEDFISSKGHILGRYMFYHQPRRDQLEKEAGADGAQDRDSDRGARSDRARSEGAVGRRHTGDIRRSAQGLRRRAGRGEGRDSRRVGFGQEGS